MPERAERPSPILRAHRLAGILDKRQSIALGQLAKLCKLRWIPEDVNRQDRASPRRDRILNCGRIKIERALIHVGEDRQGTLVEEAVR